MNDDQVSVNGAYHHFVTVGRESHAHQASCVKNTIGFFVAFAEPVDVPGENGSVKTGSHQAIVFGSIFDILHPFLMTPHTPELLLEVTGVPEGHCGIIGTSGK